MGPLGFYGSFMLAILVSLHKKSDVATAPYHLWSQYARRNL